MGSAGDFKEPSEISDQPLCIWDDSVIVFVKDLNEESKLKTMSPTELAEFKKQEAIRIGKMKNKNKNNNYHRPERKLEIKDDRWEKRHALEIEKQKQEKTEEEESSLNVEEVD